MYVLGNPEPISVQTADPIRSEFDSFRMWVAFLHLWCHRAAANRIAGKVTNHNTEKSTNHTAATKASHGMYRIQHLEPTLTLTV